MDSLIIFAAKYLIGAIVLVLAYVWLRANKQTKLQMMVVVVLAGVLALILSRIAGKLYFDPRPFVRSGVKPLIPHMADNGFPSDHALLSMTLTAALYFYSKKGALFASVITLGVSTARVLAHIHSPIDIAGAWVIGIVTATVVYYGVRALPWFKTPPAIPQTSG